MPRKEGHKRLLQKIAKVVSIISIFLAVVSAIYLLTINSEDEKVLKASIGAVAFFCFTLGIVLNAIANTNLPDLRINKNNKNNKTK
tara:strand:+ start:651 stop:908 length:258 start_codon:yes stop_codon:yes gene_type:complete